MTLLVKPTLNRHFDDVLLGVGTLEQLLAKAYGPTPPIPGLSSWGHRTKRKKSYAKPLAAASKCFK